MKHRRCPLCLLASLWPRDQMEWLILITGAVFGLLPWLLSLLPQ